jgi:hypothetical protein
MSAFALLLSACSQVRPECELVCRKFVTVCEFPAWSTVEQCTQGCVDDMYRRDDWQVVLDCYARAADPPTEDEAAAWVDAALAAGRWAQQVAAGSFDRPAALDLARDSLTCDAFAVVQCKVDSVLDPPSGTLIAR